MQIRVFLFSSTKLKIHHTMLLIVLLILSGNVCAFAHRSTTALEFSQNVKNNVEKINTNFIKVLHDNLKPEENLIFSPISIYVALALVHLGATGTTKTELSNFLGLPVREDKLAAAHDNLGELLRTIQHSDQDSTKVSIANGIFIQQGLRLKDGYKKNMLNYYNSDIKQLDFANGGQSPTDFVNEWIAEKTNNRIPELFLQKLPKDTVILLASALYFSGKWEHEFKPWETQNKTFNTGVAQINVPTMCANNRIPYVDNKKLKFQAISIPYLNNEFNMLIVLPYRDQSLPTLINSLKSKQLSEIISSLIESNVNYEIPRMKFRWEKDLNEHMMKLGVKQMFKNAELEKMADFDRRVKVSKITHAAEIEVNEEGTEASAVTVVHVDGSYFTLTTPPPHIPFYANRPFIFSIYDQNTGVILFTGVLQNPNAESS